MAPSPISPVEAADELVAEGEGEAWTGEAWTSDGDELEVDVDELAQPASRRAVMPMPVFALNGISQ